MKRGNGISCLDLRPSKHVASYGSAWPPSPRRKRRTMLVVGEVLDSEGIFSMWRERTIHAGRFCELKTTRSFIEKKGKCFGEKD